MKAPPEAEAEILQPSVERTASRTQRPASPSTLRSPSLSSSSTRSSTRTCIAFRTWLWRAFTSPSQPWGCASVAPSASSTRGGWRWRRCCRSRRPSAAGCCWRTSRWRRTPSERVRSSRRWRRRRSSSFRRSSIEGRFRRTSNVPWFVVSYICLLALRAGRIRWWSRFSTNG